jgi:hypothetical protein
LLKKGEVRIQKSIGDLKGSDLFVKKRVSLEIRNLKSPGNKSLLIQYLNKANIVTCKFRRMD